MFYSFTYLPSAQRSQDVIDNSKRIVTGLNSEFLSACITKANETSISYYLPFSEGRKNN